MRTAPAHGTSKLCCDRPPARPPHTVRALTSLPPLLVHRPLAMLSLAALAPASFSAPVTSRASSRSTVSMSADVSRRALLTTAAGALFMPLAAQAPRGLG